ncbi:hypothetical protein Cs7R123_27610 [Catellatospora sp. TT07R-123]|uniref:hypothetical protein n=1 Tax=Catellatospora sp. TT07R-123 TaxID=2733863 RepID=UPI001B0D33CC|nr:hypothetical protein [Catellatospora sp. TT07R-123]GHJ45419.1 hypothetical protein Cs7R123_27610 [Catellatospora sp. TT07R-123]
MESIPWFGWVAIIGAVSWVIPVVLHTLRQRPAVADDALRASLDGLAATNRQLAQRLDQVDQRLGKIETTLNDIP